MFQNVFSVSYFKYFTFQATKRLDILHTIHADTHYMHTMDDVIRKSFILCPLTDLLFPIKCKNKKKEENMTSRPSYILRITFISLLF